MTAPSNSFKLSKAGLLLPTMALLGLALLVVSVFHVGFQASDDFNYVLGALGWLEKFPFVGDSHWTLRHTITLPTAAFVAVLGLNETAVSLSGIAYFLGFLAVNLYGARHFIGLPAAVSATLLMLSVPGFPVTATYLNPDITELFFVTSAFWCLLRARQAGVPGHYMWLCGVMAGLGFVNRQTSGAFVLFVLILVVFYPGQARSKYLPAALAFVAVVAAEWLYLTAATGNPLYRMQVDFHHGATDRFAEFAGVAAHGRWIDNQGNLAVGVLVDPLLSLFVSQKYASLFWLAIPACVALWHLRPSSQRASLLLIGALGFTSFLFVAANPKLLLVPRYLIVAAWSAAMLAGWHLGQLWSLRRWSPWACLTSFAVLLSVLSYSVENIDPRHTERQLVKWVKTHVNEAIYTDIETRSRSELFFRFENVPMDNVIAAAPPPGVKFFYCATCVKVCGKMPRCAERVRDFIPQSTWTIQETLVGPRRLGGSLAKSLDLDKVLPSDVSGKLIDPISNVVIYRVE